MEYRTYDSAIIPTVQRTFLFINGELKVLAYLQETLRGHGAVLKYRARLLPGELHFLDEPTPSKYNTVR